MSARIGVLLLLCRPLGRVIVHVAVLLCVSLMPKRLSSIGSIVALLLPLAVRLPAMCFILDSAPGACFTHENCAQQHILPTRTQSTEPPPPPLSSPWSICRISRLCLTCWTCTVLPVTTVLKVVANAVRNGVPSSILDRADEEIPLSTT